MANINTTATMKKTSAMLSGKCKKTQENLKKLMADGVLAENPIIHSVAAVSAGIVQDVPMLDLQYEEDSNAMVDLNCVMTEAGELIEIQGTGEGRPFTLAEQQTLVELCAKGIRELSAIQREVAGDVL